MRESAEAIACPRAYVKIFGPPGEVEDRQLQPPVRLGIEASAVSTRRSLLR
jgi:hypothetical protein